MLHKHHNIYTIFTLVLTLLFCLPIVAQQQSVSTNSNSATTLDKAKQPDAPSAIAERFFNGMNAGDQYGRSVSSAGDVNGDGYDDLIIGAPFYDDGVNTIAGRAYIYFGGNIINNMPDVTLTGEAVDDRFGFSVSSAGDVNGDGYSDVIVGAYVNNNFTGKSYIFFGGSTISGNINASSADVTMTGEATSNRFGWSVSSAGDVNGDGYSDVIVGAYQHNTSTGKSYVFFGGSSMSGNIATSSADVTITGETTHNRFGYSVSSTGDVNGDGYSDVIVGAYQHNNFTGKSYVFFGGSSMSGNIAAASADVTMTGETTSGDHFGISVSSAGDVNGDGYSDVIVGAYGNNSYTGKSYIYFGGSTMNSTPDVIMTGETASDSFGFSVAAAGDMNADGYDDFIVGAIENDINGTNSGRAYLYLNSLTGSDIADDFFTGETTSNEFGYSVSSAGDVNGDGYSDVIVGAYRNNSSTGKSYIYFGGPDRDNIADVTQF